MERAKKLTLAHVAKFLDDNDVDTSDLFRVEFSTQGITLWRHRRYTTGPKKGEIMIDGPGGQPQVKIERMAYA